MPDLHPPCPPRTQLAVVSRILRRLAAEPTACALQFRALHISNATLLDKVLRLARRFAELGIGRECRVAVCLERSPEHLVVVLALWQREAVYVPFDAEFPRERLLDMCSVAEIAVVLTHPQLQQGLSTLPVKVMALADMDFTEPAAEGAALCDESPPSADASVDCQLAERQGAPAEVRLCGGTAQDASAYILFTSGSTGRPKGVQISQHNLAALFCSLEAVLPCGIGKRVLACAAYGFDIALFELLAPLLWGGTIVLADQETSRDAALLAGLIASSSIDVVQATPSLWQLLNRYAWNPQGRNLLAISTGEALPRSVAVAILERTSELWNLYGPTECTVWASAHRVSSSDLHAQAPAIVAIGKPLPHVVLELRKADAARQVEADGQRSATVGQRTCADTVGVDATGELWIGGDGVGLGYCGAVALSNAVFMEARNLAQQTSVSGSAYVPDDRKVDVPTVQCPGQSASTAASERTRPGPAGARWYRSGDLCRRDTDGNLHFLARLDSQVKVNGYRIELDEITRLLLQHASILNAACLVRTLPDARGTLLFACVVCIPGMPNKNRDSLNQYLARFLPGWMLPHRYYFLNELPLTGNGKLDRVALLALAAPAGNANDVPRGNDDQNQAALQNFRGSGPDAGEIMQTADVLERRIAALFCEVLDIGSIGPCDSFLDFGGSSMLSATLVMLLNQRFGTRLTLRQVLATPPTVRSIMKLLTEAGISVRTSQGEV